VSGYVLRSTLPDIVQLMPNRARRIVRETVLLVETDIKLAMQGPKSGRAYQRGGKMHIASAKGEAPAIDTSNLIESIHVEHETGPTSYVNVGADYAEGLEFGTSKMAARPSVGPAMEKNRPGFEAQLGKAVFETVEVSG
jgi:HK97 gp10 family phage protein